MAVGGAAAPPSLWAAQNAQRWRPRVDSLPLAHPSRISCWSDAGIALYVRLRYESVVFPVIASTKERPPRSATWFDSRFRYSSVVFTAIAAESARAPASEIWLRARSSRSSFGSDAFRYLRSSAEHDG